MSALGVHERKSVSGEEGRDTHVGTRPPGLDQSAGADDSTDDENAVLGEESITIYAGASSVIIGRRVRESDDLLMQLRRPQKGTASGYRDARKSNNAFLRRLEVYRREGIKSQVPVDVPMSLCAVYA